MQWHKLQLDRRKGPTKASNANIVCLGLVLVPLLALLACGPSDEEIDRKISEGVSQALAQIPTSTPVIFPTPLPTATPSPLATPRPTVTPQPAPTPMTLPATPTPVLFPPTPTPLVLPPTPTAQPILDFSKIYQRSWPSVFLIEADDGRGSGWLIEPGLILTNEHVIRGSTRVTVRQASSPPFSATVLAVDSWRDIALLRFDPAQVRLPRNARPLRLGEVGSEDIASTLLALGYSGAGVKTNGTVGSAPANVGVLSQITDLGDTRRGFNLVMDAPSDPGDSGGPVLDSSGQVVGMIRAAQERTSGGQRVVGIFFAVHVDEIRTSLPALKRGQSR